MCSFLKKEGVNYGIVNGCVFTSISFEHCDFNGTKIPQIEVERRLFSLSGFKFVTQEVELDEVSYQTHSFDFTYKGVDYIIKFVIEVKNSVLYVISIEHQFLEVSNG